MQSGGKTLNIYIIRVLNIFLKRKYMSSKLQTNTSPHTMLPVVFTTGT